MTIHPTLPPPPKPFPALKIGLTFIPRLESVHMKPRWPLITQRARSRRKQERMSYEIFLEEEKKYLAHLHKQLKPAAYLKFLIWPAVITFPFGFHGVSVFNIRYFK